MVKSVKNDFLAKPVPCFILSHSKSGRVVWFVTGGDLCEVCESLRGSVPAACGAELPSYCNPQGHVTGGEVRAASHLPWALKTNKKIGFNFSGVTSRY